METTYRLEFNVKDQIFHMDDYRHVPYTAGYYTLREYCTDLEFMIFEAYINRTKKDRFSVEYLLKCLAELEVFLMNLTESNITIIKS